MFLLAGSSCEEVDDDRNDDESDNECPEPFHDRRQAQGCDDTYRAVSPEAVQMATSALREVLIALGDTEPHAGTSNHEVN